MPDTLAVVNSLTAAERATMDRPPPLEYSLRTRKLSISVFWTLVVVDIIVVPLALYFGLRYHTKLSNNAGA